MHPAGRDCPPYQNPLTKHSFLYILPSMHIFPVPSHPPYPVRARLPHDAAPFPSLPDPVQFITVCARNRTGAPFLPVADTLLAAARHCQERGIWFLRLFLVMPDHIHALLSVARDASLAATVSNWKHYLSRTSGIAFQRDFFEHRMRNEAETSETWTYIRNNPVRKGLAAHADEWPHWLGFHPFTGEELPRHGG